MADPLPTNVRRMGWISFFTDACSELVYPIYPLFLTETLKAPVTALAAIEGTAIAVASLLKAWSGIRSDVSGRRVGWIRAGYFLGNIGKPLTALAPTWGVVFAIRIADRIGKGLRTSPRDALLANSMPADEQGRAFGFQRAMDMAGATVGILGAALLVWLLPGQYRTIFLIAAVPGLIAVGLTWMLHDPPPGEARVKAVAPIRSLPKSFLPILAVSALYGFAASSDALLLLRASGMGFDALGVVGLYAMANLIASLGAYPAATWSDRIGRKRLLAAGWAIYGLVYVGLAASGFWLAPWLFAAYGVQLALTEGAVRAWAVDEVSPEARGTALGLFHATVGLSALAGNLAVGLVWDQAGASPALLISAAASLLACLGLFVLPSGRTRR